MAPFGRRYVRKTGCHSYSPDEPGPEPQPEILTFFLNQATIPGIGTSSLPHPAIDLATQLYYQLVYTLTDLLPPPLDGTPKGLRARKRLLRQNADDLGLVMRLNAQYASMVRTSLSVLGRLMRVQALRQKREAIDGAANQDAWAQHVAERSMLLVTDPNAGPQQAARPKGPPVATRVEAPAAGVDQRVADNISENATNSQDAAFETWLSEQSWNLGSRGSDETGLREVLHEAMAESHLAGRQLPADGRESAGRAD
jgi:hypothetical protein